MPVEKKVIWMLKSIRGSRTRFILLVGILLTLFQFGTPTQDVAYGATAEPDVLAFTSDVHNNQSNYKGETRLGTWIDNVISQYGKIDTMAFGGDMAQYNSDDDRFWNETQRVMNVVEGKGIPAYYTTGNHEYAHPGENDNNFYPDKNSTTAKYIQNDWAVSDNVHNYRIYCMGVGEASNYSYVQNAYTANQVSTLESKLAAVDNSKPIFIITHFPLHYSSSRTITRASDVIDVLNTAANGGTPSDPSDDKKIVFIWGHNHSQNNPNDTHYDTIYQKGSSLQYDSSHTKEVQFFYAAAGAMCDTEKDAGSGKVKGKGLVATVNSKDQITLAYHKEDGTTVTENGGAYDERDPVAVTGLTIDEAAEAGQNGLSVEARRVLQLHASIEPSDAADKTVTWSSSDTTIATVDNTGKVTGVAEGQTTITASITDSVSGETFTDSIVVNVTPRTTSGTPYVLTNTLTPGKNYLIVSANSGGAYALKNDGGTVSKEAVTIDGDTIFADNEDIVFEAQGSGTTINDLHNGNKYLKAHSEGLELLDVAGTTRPWEYNSSNHSLRNYKSGGNPSYYYVYYDNNAFTSVKSTVHAVYIFEETELPEDVTYNVTFKVQNGKWDDNTTADKTVQLTGPEGSVTLSANQIPAVGNKPNSGYKAGSWDVTPNTSTALTGNVTYTYTYEEKEEQGSEKAYVLTNELKAGKNYIISNTNSGTAHVLANNSSTTAEVTIDGDTIYTDDSSIVFKMGEGSAVNYIENGEAYVHHTDSNYVDFVSTPPSGITWTYDGSYLTYKDGGSTYYLYFKSGNGYNKYRIKSQSTASDEQLVYLFEEEQTDVSYDVTFQVENGKWNDDTAEEQTVTLTGPAGTELKLSADQIPAVGGKPDTHYEAGAWDVTPDTSTAITEDTTYKYTYIFVDHDWGEGEVTLSPTCTEEGVKTFTCSVGGETKTEAIPATGHIWEEEFTEDTAPTCTEAGSKSKHCSVCGVINEATITEIPATGHNFGEWAEVTASTCENAGLEQRVCGTCGFTESNNLDPKGHDWEDEFTVDVEPTCTTDGSKSKHCTRCEAVNDSETIDALGHDYKDVDGTAEAATCTKAGREANQKCSRCNDEIEGAVIAALGHDYIPVEGSAVAATCTEEGREADQKCSRCNDEVQGAKIDALGHDYQPVEGSAKAPTCTETGNEANQECSRCHDVKQGAEIEALGHDIKTHLAKAATCTEDGNTLYYNCDRCSKFFGDALGLNEVEEGNWVIPATGHNLAAHAATEATCTAAGNNAYWSCDKCEKFFSDAEGKTVISENSWVINALGHDWEEATYTSPKTCKRCAETEGEALSHDSSEERFVEVSQLANGKDYIVAVTKDDSSVYVISNAGASAHVSAETLTVVPADGDEPAYIVTDKEAVVWAYTSSDQHLTNQSLYLNRAGSSGNYYPIAESTGREAHYVDGKLYLKKSSSSSTYYITCNNGTFGLSENASGGDRVRLFEKTTVDIRTQNIKFVNDDGTVLQDRMIERGQIPSYAGETPTKEATEDYTYTFAGWTDGTNEYGIDDTLPAAKADVTYTARYDSSEIHHHKMTEHPAVAATCTAAGSSAYWSCDTCHKFFSDEEGAREIEENSWVIAALGHEYGAWTKLNDNEHQRVCAHDGSHIEKATHNWSEWTTKKSPSCTEAGEKERTCDVCGAKETEVIEALNHELHLRGAEVAPTCTEEGNSAYWQCLLCNKYFSDENGENEIEEGSWVIPAGHVMTHHEGVEASCTENGSEEYWSCSRCHKYFADEAGENEVEENAWVIPAGHDWSKPTYVWAGDNSSVTAEYHCTVEGCNEEVTETVNTTSEVTKGATCTEAGTTKYTATFEDEKFEDQEKTDDTKPAALGHNWGEVAYTWAEDNRTVTAKRVCGRDNNHIEEETVNTTFEVTQQATCTLPEKTTWTSDDFENSAFAKQTKTEETAEANGHDWSRPRYDWADDFSTVTGHYNCTVVDCDEEVTETVNTTSEISRQATCTEAGETTYSATFEDPRLEDQKEVDATKPAALGHTWGEVSYTWAEDNSKVTAERVCSRDENHKETETVDASSKVTKNATCTEKGETTYTSANFENDAFEIQQKTVEDVSALGHNMTTHLAVAATCTEPGNSVYWSCDRCHKYFSDPTGLNEIADGSWVIAATGHTWGEASYTWSEENSKVTAERVCTKDGTHKESETVDATSEVTQAATCTLPEKTTWTSEDFENQAFAKQTKTEQTANATGHTWGEVSYTWSEDNSKVTAERVCTKDDTHKETETVDAASQITQQATCTLPEKTTWTSEDFENQAFAKQTKTEQTANATGHEWGEVSYTWSEDNSKVTAERVCTKDGTHKESETVDAASQITQQATCTLPEKTTWTSDDFENEAFAKQTKTEQTANATGHTWDAGKVTKAATETATGIKTYTCTVCKATKTETIPKKADPSKNPNKKGADGTAVGKGASAAAANKAITSAKTDADPKGSKYSVLKLESPKQTKNSVTLTWTKAKGANKYVIYGNVCGKNKKLKKLRTVGNKNKFTVKKLSKKLKKGTYHKFIIVALDKNNMVVSTSKVIHVATKGGKITNPKKVTVKKDKKAVTKVTVKKGKSLKLKGTVTKAGKKLKLKKHRVVTFETSNKKIATVTKAGKVVGKKKGTCYVYAYAQNGIFKRVKVTVK